MAFNIMDLFAPAARNMLLQPQQSAAGVQNMLLSRPSPQNYPVAGVPAPPAVDPQTVAAVQGPSAPMAASVGPQVAQAAPQQQPFFNEDRKAFLNDLFTGWAAGSSPSESLAYGAKLVAANSQGRKGKNETIDWLKGKGVDEATAKQLASNPPALNAYLKNLYADQNDELINAGGSLYNKKTGQWITPPAGASRPTEYGLNLIYGKDDKGNTVAYQLSKDGTYKPFTPPDGVQLTPGIAEINAGTGTVLTNSKTGERMGYVPKDVAGQSAQEASGKATGEAQAAIPSAEMTAGLVQKQIDELKGDPYLDRMVGPVDSWLPNVSSDAARVQGRMNQLQGGAFLQARQMLKGGGAITDYEGAKAEDAYARLQTAQSEQDYRKALDDFNEAVQLGLRKLYRQAGQQPSQQQQQPSNSGQQQRYRYNPATGELE